MPDHIREFDILSFIVRHGRVHRMDRQTRNLSTTDNVPGIIARTASGQVAQGRYVLVLEQGAILPQFSRVAPHAIRALRELNRDDYRKFARNVEHLAGVEFDAFASHVARSFPQ